MQPILSTIPFPDTHIVYLHDSDSTAEFSDPHVHAMHVLRTVEVQSIDLGISRFKSPESKFSPDIPAKRPSFDVSVNYGSAGFVPWITLASDTRDPCLWA